MPGPLDAAAASPRVFLFFLLFLLFPRAAPLGPAACGSAGLCLTMWGSAGWDQDRDRDRDQGTATATRAGAAAGGPAQRRTAPPGNAGPRLGSGAEGGAVPWFRGWGSRGDPHPTRVCPQGHTAPEPPLGPPGLAHNPEKPRSLRKGGRRGRVPRGPALSVFAQGLFAQTLLLLFPSAPSEASGRNLSVLGWESSARPA